MSHLTRGAWIEILNEQDTIKIHSNKSHLTRGAWIEMVIQDVSAEYNLRRTSHEVRGLKYAIIGGVEKFVNMSHLTRGVWEEFWCVNEPIS